MRAIPLTSAKGGISRLRIKGGARADTLYDLVNGRVTEQETIVAREGTVTEATVPSTTRGLMFFKSKFHVFSHQAETVPTGYINHILTHPTNLTLTLSKIHFAQPFMGAPYVVAQFSDGSIFHYWLSASGTWQANHVYKLGDVVLASADTGLLYRATRNDAANQTWQANVPRAVDDKVEPTTYNDFFYKVIDVEGTAPRSGLVEPAWPEADGATVYEDADSNTTGSSTVPVTYPPTSERVPPDVVDRYA